jgi:hypothetical protein
VSKIKIDNTKKSAVTSKKWDPDVKALTEIITNYTGSRRELADEIFLVVDRNRGKDQYYNTTTCHYPHHDIIDVRERTTKQVCVLNIKGVQAAYARAKQQGIYEGAVKEHLDRHRKELGMDIKDQKLEEAARNVDAAFNLLTEAINGAAPPNPQNMFEDYMIEKPVVNTGIGGNPIPADPAQNPAAPPATPATPVQPNVQQPATAQPAPAPVPPPDPNAGQAPPQNPPPPTIPVQNVDPTEDTSVNNPYEGPDTRDQDNLDGNARKEQYQKFADALKEIEGTNVFSTIFDEDVFKSEYKIVPYEMRYFYRLQNPVTVKSGDFEFIPMGEELLKAQEKYDLGKKMFVFGLYSEKPVFFNMLDKTIWFNDKKVAETFDGFIDNIIRANGMIDLVGDEEGAKGDANVQYTPDAQPPIDLNQSAAPDPNNPLANDAIDLSPPPDPNAAPASDPMAPLDLTQTPADMGATPTASPAPGAAPVGGELPPLDLTQTNASIESDSILDMMESKDDKHNEDHEELEDLTTYNSKLLHDTLKKMNIISETATTRQMKESINDQKRKIISAYMEQHPGLSENDMRQSLLDFFGESIDSFENSIIVESLFDKKYTESVKSITDSIPNLLEETLGFMTEGVAFPNDELDERNRREAEERRRRRIGTMMTD